PRRPVVALAVAAAAATLGLIRRLIHVVRVLRSRVGLDRVGLNDISTLARAQHPDRGVGVAGMVLLRDRGGQCGLLALGVLVGDLDTSARAGAGLRLRRVLVGGVAVGGLGVAVDAVGLPHVPVLARAQHAGGSVRVRSTLLLCSGQRNRALLVLRGLIGRLDAGRAVVALAVAA